MRLFDKDYAVRVYARELVIKLDLNVIMRHILISGKFISSRLLLRSVSCYEQVPLKHCVQALPWKYK